MYSTAMSWGKESDKWHNQIPIWKETKMWTYSVMAQKYISITKWINLSWWEVNPLSLRAGCISKNISWNFESSVIPWIWSSRFCSFNNPSRHPRNLFFIRAVNKMSDALCNGMSLTSFNLQMSDHSLSCAEFKFLKASLSCSLDK